MKLLIVYGSTEGQTSKICEFLRDEAQKSGHQVSLVNASGPDMSPESFEAVIIGASLHIGKYQSSVTKYVREHLEILNKIPGIFVSVSLTAANDDAASWKELKKATDAFLAKTGWHPEYVEQVAGALVYSKYNFFKKYLMRMIARKNGGDVDTSRDYEYTDWDQVKGILKRLEESLSESKAERLS